MPNSRFHRLPALEPAPLLSAQTLVLAAMNDLHRGVVRIHAPESQVDRRFFRSASHVFQQDCRLLQLGGQKVAVIRIAGKRPRPDYQATLVRDGDYRVD